MPVRTALIASRTNQYLVSLAREEGDNEEDAAAYESWAKGVLDQFEDFADARKVLEAVMLLLTLSLTLSLTLTLTLTSRKVLKAVMLHNVP